MWLWGMVSMRFHSTVEANSRAYLRAIVDLMWRGVVSRGQSLVEYALIIVLVALAVALALSLLAPTLNSIFRAIPPAL